jgi:hypothetical protein
MKQGDHVNATGIDGSYVFLKEVKGRQPLVQTSPPWPLRWVSSFSGKNQGRVIGLAWPMDSRRDGHKASLMMFTFSLGLSR